MSDVTDLKAELLLLRRENKELRERIVRCRDCKRAEDKAGFHGCFWCWYQERRVEPDGFCAWGVRRDA